MIFLPVVQRELTVAGRRRWTYRVRCVAAGLLALIAGLLLGFVGNNGPAGLPLPRLIFNLVSSIAFAVALLGGLLLTTDAITSERRDGTLGLLFLTGLTGSDIVLGKLVSCGIQGFCALLGVLPILAVPLMMGGISWTDFWCTSWLLGATLLGSAGIGLWSSSRAPGVLPAFSQATLGLGVWCLGPILPKWTLNQAGVFPAWTDAILVLSPVVGLGRALAAGRLPGRTDVQAWSALVATALAGAGALAAAARVLHRTGRTGLPGRDLPKSVGSSAPPDRAGIRPGPSAGENPYAWLLHRRRPQIRALHWVLGLTCAGTLGVLGLALLVPRPRGAVECFITALFSAYACHVLFKLRLALLSTAQMVEDQAGGGLELLLCTPLPPAYILAGQSQAVRKATQRHLAGLVLLNLAFLAALADDDLGIDGPDLGLFLALFLGGIVHLWVDRACLIRRGAWQALRTPKLNHALARTLLPVLVQPWLAALGIFLIAARGMSEDTAFTLFFIAQAAQVLASGILARRAQNGLERDFLQRAGGSSPAGAPGPAPVPGTPRLA
ncbi:MAG: hypothetical protein ACKO3N_16720 [Verrucomicrobiota bacterium]